MAWLVHAVARRALAEVLDAVYPPCCALCGDLAENGVSCARHTLGAGPSGPRCGVCAARLPRAIPTGSRCAACRRRPPGIRRVAVLADYRNPAREWILALKYGGRRDLARPLGAMLAARLCEEDLGERPVLVPVPLHRWRRMERGYDQALLLARAIHELRGGDGGVGFARALARRRETVPQGSAGAVSRDANVRDAFCVRALRARRVSGRDVWLVDDVITSGATIRECARALRRAGAQRVNAVAVARAGRGAPGGARAS